VGFLQKLGLAPVPKAVVLDEMSLEVVAELDVGGHGGDIAADSHSVWVTTHGDRVLSRIDPASRAEAARVELPRKPVSVTADGFGPVVLCEKRVIVRADPGGAALLAQNEVPEDVTDIVASSGSLWALRPVGGFPADVRLLQLDPSSLAVLRVIPVATSTYFGGLRAADGIVSVLVEDPPGSMRDAVFDVETGEPLPDERRIQTRGIAERDGNRWVSDGDRGFKRVDMNGGGEWAVGKAPGPATGTTGLAQGNQWVINYRRPTRGNPDELTD